MSRIHKVMADVVLAERKVRGKRKHVQNMLQTFDRETYAKVTCALPACERQEGDLKLLMVKPTKGLHKYSHHRNLYEAIHEFLQNGWWRPIQHETNIGGHHLD